MTQPPGRTAERVFAGLLLLALAVCVCLDLRSHWAAALRTSKPVAGLLSLRLPRAQRPPALYAVVYAPAAGTLDLLVLPPSLAVDASSTTLGEVYARAAADGGPESASEAIARAALAALAGQGAWPGNSSEPFRIVLTLPGERIPSPFEVRGALAAAVADPLFWLRLPRRLRRMGALRSGLSPYDALLFAWRLSRLRPDGVSLSRPPGGKVARLVPELFSSVRSPAGERGAGAAAMSAEVINASGAGGVALRATKLLRLRGVDVVHFGNAQVQEPTVRIVVHSGGPDEAGTVLDALGCPEAGTLVELEPDPQATVTVILGRDYTRCTRLDVRSEPWN